MYWRKRQFSRTLCWRVSTGLIAVVLSSCQSPTTLKPAPEAEQVPGVERAATSEAQGVTILVDAEAWEGELGVLEYVTPLYVEIANDSDSPLRLRYSDFALVEPDSGERFAALPPYSVDGSIAERVVARYDEPVTHFGFHHHRFHISPFYHGVYPGMDYWHDPFYFDRGYYDHYFDYWREKPLPTREMLRRVIPEGVIDPGGSLSGFLYLEKVPEEIERVDFRFELTNPNNGERFGMMSIPFLVNGE